jgi:DNA-binding GntR family transcriptional regulator
MDETTLSPIKKQQNYTDSAIDTLRTAIITGQLGPGERLLETSLGKQLGISRVPVREALRTLEAEGIIIKSSGRGYEVWSPTKDDVDEIVDLRFVLEVKAYNVLVGAISASDQRRLNGLLDEIKISFDEKDFRRTLKYDREFHESLIRMSGLPRVHKFWLQIISQLEVLLVRGSSIDLPFDSTRFVNSHKQILDNLVKGDLATAISTLDRHCEQSKQGLKPVV